MTKFTGAVVSPTIELAVKDDSGTDTFADFNEDDIAEAREVSGAEPDFSQRGKAGAVVEVQRNVTELGFQNVSHFNALTPTEALRFTDRSSFVINQSDQAHADTAEFAMRTGLPGKCEGFLGHRLKKLHGIAAIRDSLHALQMAIQVAQSQKRFDGPHVNTDSAAFTWVDVNKARFSTPCRRGSPHTGFINQALSEKAMDNAGNGSFFETSNFSDADARNRLPFANDVQHDHFVNVTKDSVISRFEIAEVDFSHKRNLEAQKSFLFSECQSIRAVT